MSGGSLLRLLEEILKRTLVRGRPFRKAAQRASLRLVEALLFRRAWLAPGFRSEAFFGLSSGKRGCWWQCFCHLCRWLLHYR
jgi:hypothetical protein